MKCFVTGASGFIGSNLVRELTARGHRVRALIRPNADERALAGVSYDRVTGDILDRSVLERGMEDCDWCFHVAASYQLWMKDYASMYQINVEGTRNVLEGAGKNGCRRIVYTSTVGCIGLPQKIKGRYTPTTEYDAGTEAQMTNHYKRSKFQAEAVAVFPGDEGLDARGLVNPAVMADHVNLDTRQHASVQIRHQQRPADAQIRQAALPLRERMRTHPHRHVHQQSLAPTVFHDAMLSRANAVSQ